MTAVPDTLFSSVSTQYESPATTGSVWLTPALDQFGSSLVTVSVTDGGLDADFVDDRR